MCVCARMCVCVCVCVPHFEYVNQSGSSGNVCTTSGSQYLLKHTQGIGIQLLAATVSNFRNQPCTYIYGMC